MEDLVLNFAQHRKAILCCLKARFQKTLSEADLYDAISTAYEKLLLDSRKPVPKLAMTVGTLQYLAYLAAIDTYRKTRRLVYIDTMLENGPLSKSLFNDVSLEEKWLIERVIAEVNKLPPQRKRMMENKYDAFTFGENATYADMISTKSHAKYCSKKEVIELGFPSEIAARQARFRTLAVLRSNLMSI